MSKRKNNKQRAARRAPRDADAAAQDGAEAAAAQDSAGEGDASASVERETVFMTGGTGYIGSYVLDVVLREHPGVDVMLLTRARDQVEGVEKLWRAMQLHMDEATFRGYLDRVRFVEGDLTAPGLGIAPEARATVAAEAGSVLHIAASLNRKSSKACLNSNLRGTLAVIRLAREIEQTSGLRRFSHVSTTAVAGERADEVVAEDASIDWERSDYDPYARTKKFCEHMVRELLPDVQRTFFRPSTVMGDSRHARTTQFDMVRAFCTLADLPLLPMRGDARQDIVNADFVGRAIAELHLKRAPEHEIYHLSSGAGSKQALEIARAMLGQSGKRPPVFAPWLGGGFERLVDALASSRRRSSLTLIGSLLKVFWPYITFNTVFDNTRVTEELGRMPVPFTEYCADLYAFAKGVGYAYPHAPLSAPATEVAASLTPTTAERAASTTQEQAAR